MKTFKLIPFLLLLLTVAMPASAQKKTQKTPDKEIDKALKLKKEYYERKRTKDV